MFTFSSTDITPSLLRTALVLAVVAAIVGVVVWRGRRRGSRTIALDAALALSAWWVLLATAGAVIIVVKAFTVDWVELDGKTSTWLPWPANLPCSEYGDSAGTVLTCSGNSLSEFVVSNASLGLRLLAGGAQLSSAALTTMPALILAVICFQTLRGRTFSRTVTRALTGGAIAVLVLGVATELLGGIAATAALREVFEPSSEWYPEAFQVTVTPFPFAYALGLVALAAVFREGSRLQQERELLQQETARLQKDTEGLV